MCYHETREAGTDGNDSHLPGLIGVDIGVELKGLLMAVLEDLSTNGTEAGSTTTGISVDSAACVATAFTEGVPGIAGVS